MPEPAGQDNESLRILHEHGLAGEEVAEVDAKVHPLVEALLEGQLDAQPHGYAVALDSALVRGLHGARTAAGNDGYAGFSQFAAHFDAQLVVRGAGLGAGGPEHADGRAEVGEGTETFHELALDPEHAPRIRVDELTGALGVQQVLVRHLHGRLFTAKLQRPLVTGGNGRYWS